MKLSYLLSTLLILFITPSFSYAQSIIFIKDADSGEPISGVRASISNGTAAFSDEQGKVTFDLEEKSKITLSHLAYESSSLDLSQGQSLTFRMKKRTTQLSEVVVSSFGTERSLLNQAASVSKIEEADLYRFNETSMVNAFNTKPGIRFEERAPGSYRISIRGSSLRAPFGVRNVKIYWDGIPFTAPDGTTALNILDLTNTDGAEVIKGPAGSIYGAGNGGVISFTQKEVQENSAEVEAMGGSYGLQKYRVAVRQKTENGSLSASFVKQKSDGYREHSALDRSVLQVSGQFNPSDRQELRTQILYSDLFYEIPGGLNADQYAENPQQARPGSANQNASIKQKTLYGTLVHAYDISSKWANQTSLYIQTTDFENPFNLDYKKETQYGYGGRTKFTLDDKWGQFPVRMIVGGEYQFANTSAQNFGNRNGQADTIRFSDDLLASQGFLFQQLEVSWTPTILMTAGLSENFSRFDINRTVDASTGLPYEAGRTFDPVLVPRIAISAQLNEKSSVFGSISSGFSPPTIDEVRTNEGSINLDLDPERGTNYETGYRGAFFENNLRVEGSLFYFKLNETITTYTNDQGVVLFRNAGATDQKGFEAKVDYDLIHSPGSWLQGLRIGHAYSYHHFRFKDYYDGGEDLSGNKLTGVPPNNLVNTLDLQTISGLYLNFTYQWVDSIPLTDDNSVFQDPYHLANLRIGWRTRIGEAWTMEAFAGVDNLLDEKYSLGNDLNAFGGRYYQPAAARNYYGGLKFRLAY